MWKVKFVDDIWLAKGKHDPETTSNESDAWLLPNLPAVHVKLKKARSLNPYPDAVMIAAFDGL